MKLKPCPFCGGEAEMEALSGGIYSVTCTACDINIAPMMITDTEEEAVEAWNRRGDWISVKDRLPGSDECVLAVVNGCPCETVKLIGAYELCTYSSDEGWIVEEYPEWEGATVTHWMPLPEPPREESEDGREQEAPERVDAGGGQGGVRKNRRRLPGLPISRRE